MKKLHKAKIILLVVMLISYVFFSNDFGLIDIEKTAIIAAVGIDKAQSEYEITVQIAVPQATDTNAVNNKAVVSAKGATASEAIHQIGDITGWYPKLAFCNLIIFGESMKSENIKAVLDYFARTFKIQDSACVAGCECSAKKLLSTATPLDNISAFAVQKILLKNRGMTIDVATTDIKTFSVGYYSRTGSSFMPMIKMIPVSGQETSEKADGSGGASGDTGESSSSSGSQSSSGGSGKNFVFDASKTLLFKNGKVVDELDDHETKAFNLFREKVSENIFYVDDVEMDGKKINAVLTVIDNKTNIKFYMDKATPVLKMTADIFCRLEDTSNVDKQESLKSSVFIPLEVSKKAEEVFGGYVDGIIEKCKTSGCDLLNLDEKLFRYYHNYYDALKDKLYENLRLEKNITFRGLE